MSMLRLLCLRAASAALMLATVLAPAHAAAQTTDDPRFFTQTGFRVDNDAFWNFFQARGGVRTFGYPVSRSFMLLGFPVQVFQREVMQLQPDGGVQTLNLLDEGLLPYTRINGSTFPAPDPNVVGQTPVVSDPDYATKILQFVDAQAQDAFEGEPVNFDQTFHNTVTAQDAPDLDPGALPLADLQIWGAPTSLPARDPNNNDFIYQRFQRGIMHYDKGCGCTQGLLLADYLKQVLIGPSPNLPPDLAQQALGSRFLAQYAPGKPASLARPNDLPGTDLSSAFDPQQPGATAAAPAAPAPSGKFAYGLQVQLWDFSAQGKSLVVGNVKQAGFNWMKHQVEWQTVEPAAGQYDWRELDNIVNSGNSQGINVMLSVAHAPTFYRSATSGLMPSDPSTFQNLMQAMAARYKGKVQAYELWNEENLAREAGPPNIDPSNYLPLLKAGFTGVKAGDPTALTLLGALSPTGANTPGVSMDDVSYLQALYAINGGEVRNYFDVLGAHPSGFAIPPDCTPDTPSCSLVNGWNNDPSFFAFYRVSQYHDVLTANNDAGRTIWFTEFGYCSNPTPPPGYEYCASVTEQAQAQMLARAFQKSRETSYVGGMFVWNLNFQQAVQQTDEKWGFGLLRADLSPRPAFTALANLPKN
jgi:polysaccharide biosynthesis protein PslG